MKGFGVVLLGIILVAAIGGGFLYFSGNGRQATPGLEVIADAEDVSAVEGVSRVNPVESSTQPSSVVEVEKMATVETDFVKAVPFDLTAISESAVEGIEIQSSQEEQAGIGNSDDWTKAVVDLAALNSDLIKIEQMSTKTGLLPEAEVIEELFANFNSQLEELKSRSIPAAERDQIRESLKNSTGPLLGQIYEALEARDENHLVHLAQGELARTMESLQGF